MSRLQSLEKRLLPRKQQNPEPQFGLAAAIESLIAEQVDRRLDAALDRAPERMPPRLKQILPDTRPEYTSFDQVQPPPRVAPPLDLTVQIQRDELKRASVITVGKTTFAVQRDGEGRMVRLVPSELGVSPTPGVPPAPLNGG